MSAASEEAPSPHSASCKMCGAEMPEHAVLCVACGYDTRIGRIRSRSDRPLRKQSGSPLSEIFGFVALMLGVGTMAITFLMNTVGLRVVAFACLFTMIAGLATIAAVVVEALRGYGFAKRGVGKGFVGMILAMIPVLLLLPYVQQLRAEAHLRNLRTLATALHNYHESMARFPPGAIRDKDGQPLLSWRVAILPFIEQDNLYRAFKLDEPWDSPHNKPLLQHMPKTFRLPGVAPNQQFATHYLGISGPGTLFGAPKGLPMAAITDGTSNTVLVAEAANPVPWTKPEDLDFQPGMPTPKLGTLVGKHAVVFCDGSAKLLPTTIPDQTLRALATIQGGEAIDINR